MSAPVTGPPARSRAQRRRDAEHRLAHDVDLWVATAAADGTPHLVPLSFEWDGATLLLATTADGVTGRNLAASGVVRLALGGTRDVCLVEGTVEVLAIDAVARGRADRFAARTGFDPRGPDTPHRWYRVTPRRVQAWREVDEMPGRELVREGRWTV